MLYDYIIIIIIIIIIILYSPYRKCDNLPRK